MYYHLHINLPIRMWLKKQKQKPKTLELKSYREQCRSFNFLSFIWEKKKKKKEKYSSRFLGISTLFSFKQMPQKDIGREQG